MWVFTVHEPIHMTYAYGFVYGQARTKGLVVSAAGEPAGRPSAERRSMVTSRPQFFSLLDLMHRI